LIFLTLLMTKHEVIASLRISTKRSWRNLVKFLKRNLNYIRLYLNKAKSRCFYGHNSWIGVLTNFLVLDGSELILVKFSWILELWIINYELITIYHRLIIKSIIRIILFQRLSLNSNYGIGFIILSSLFKFLQISEV
jgi:hypothetical protein